MAAQNRRKKALPIRQAEQDDPALDDGAGEAEAEAQASRG